MSIAIERLTAALAERFVVEGETLHATLDREKQLGVEEVVRITTQVADALEYAHRQEVIHPDSKPENILMHGGEPRSNRWRSPAPSTILYAPPVRDRGCPERPDRSLPADHS